MNIKSHRRHTFRDRRPSTTACPGCWAMGTRKLKYCTVRKKLFVYWADQSSQGRIKVSCTDTMGPTNQPRKDAFHPFHLYSLRRVCPLPLVAGGGGGAYSLAGEGAGESQFRRGDIHCGTLWVFDIRSKLSPVTGEDIELRDIIC